MSRDAADKAQEAIEQIVLDEISYTCLTPGLHGKAKITEFHCRASERTRKMEELGIDLTRPYAIGHPRRDNPNRYDVVGSDGDLIAELKRRLSSR